jgi:Glycosyltransferase family 87
VTSKAKRPRGWIRPIIHGAVIAGLLFAAYLFAVVGPAVGTFGFDAFAYWAVDIANPYVVPVGGLGAFTYTPVAARLFDPVGALPWFNFLWLWSAVLVATVMWLGGRRFPWILAFPPVALELFHGNIHLLLAAMIVLGFRYPAVYVFGIFTKVTPGIGIIWFLVRREWRNLAIVLGLTAVIGAVSLLVDGQLWPEWIRYALSAESGAQVQQVQVPIPLPLRVPAAALIVAWGAATDRRWTVPVAVTLALPVLWPSGFAVLAACLATSSLAGEPLVRLGRAPRRAPTEERSTAEPAS